MAGPTRKIVSESYTTSGLICYHWPRHIAREFLYVDSSHRPRHRLGHDRRRSSPARAALAAVAGWWVRALLLNGVQVALVFLGGWLWEGVDARRIARGRPMGWA